MLNNPSITLLENRVEQKTSSLKVCNSICFRLMEHLFAAKMVVEWQSSLIVRKMLIYALAL